MKRSITLLDRYVFKLVLWQVSFCFFSVASLYFLFEFAARSKHFMRYWRRAGEHSWFSDLWDIFLLSLSRMLPGLLEFAALGVLLGVILAVSQLLEKNEFVAVNAAGVSRRRFMAPAFVAALLVSLVSIGLAEKVVPDLLRRGRDLQLKILRRSGKFDSALSIQGPEPNSDLRTVIYVGRFDPDTGTADDFSAIRLRPNGSREHVRAPRARWQGNAWVFDPPGRRFDYQSDQVGQTIVRFNTRMSPTLLFYEALGPKALSWQELYRSSHRRELAVELHTRIAVLFTGIIALALALPILVGNLSANRWFAGLKAVGAALGFILVSVVLAQFAGATLWGRIAHYLPFAGVVAVSMVLAGFAVWALWTGRIRRSLLMFLLAGSCVALEHAGWWPGAGFWPPFALVWLPDFGFLALGFHLVYKRMDG